jgi:hypothetical protein
MQVERDEILSLLGPKAVAGRGGATEFVMPDTTRRARIELGEDGAIYADVTEGLEGDATEVVVLRVVPDPDGNGLEATGVDGSGESSEPRDPRSVAAAWRRLVNPMQAVRA